MRRAAHTALARSRSNLSKVSLSEYSFAITASDYPPAPTRPMVRVGVALSLASVLGTRPSDPMTTDINLRTPVNRDGPADMGSAAAATEATQNLASGAGNAPLARHSTKNNVR